MIVVVLLVSFLLSYAIIFKQGYFLDLENYLVLVFPLFFITFIISSLIAYFLAVRFTKTITEPIKEISREMLKIKEDNPEFNFTKYRYDEFNQIPSTIIKESEEVSAILEKLNFEKRVRQEFFSNASHELKTPITSIKGYTELLESDMDFDENTKKDFLSRIKKETENMASLINDILMISKLETKEVEVSIEEIRLYPLVRELVKSFTPLARSLDIKVKIDCRPLVIYANPGQIKELIGNLLSNAIKYNRQGGLVTITTYTQDNSLVIMVEDTGMGIPKESLNRIFERFYRVDKGRSKRIGGTGLGLSIVKHIAAYYGGNIQLESELNKGTKIIIMIPLRNIEKGLPH